MKKFSESREIVLSKAGQGSKVAINCIREQNLSCKISEAKIAEMSYGL